ncbi:MAG: hypothetical protein J6C33_05590 [Lachnospiraceae bacterium]|nr:hypothetical protein [Lachnospiraceae bacterium]
MIASGNDKLRQKVLQDSNYLQNSRNAGGGAVGCIAGGITLLVFAVLVGGLFALIGIMGGALIFGGLFGIPGLLLFLIGKRGKKRKAAEYLAYYQKETGYGEEELHQIEKELKEEDTIVVGFKPAGGSYAFPIVECILTRNYFVKPLMLGGCYVRRYEDMIAAAYSERIPGVGGYRSGLVFGSRQDDDLYSDDRMSKKDFAEFIGLIAERCPQLIMHEMFLLDGKKYDLLKDWKEIARQVRG